MEEITISSVTKQTGTENATKGLKEVVQIPGASKLQVSFDSRSVSFVKLRIILHLESNEGVCMNTEGDYFVSKIVII